METKEQDRPQRIENELRKEERKRRPLFHPRTICLQQPSYSQRHQPVQNRPNGREDPVGRIECGLCERRVPGDQIGIGRPLTHQESRDDRNDCSSRPLPFGQRDLNGNIAPLRRIRENRSLVALCISILSGQSGEDRLNDSTV